MSVLTKSYLLMVLGVTTVFSCGNYKDLRCTSTTLRVPSNQPGVFLVKVVQYSFQCKIDTTKVNDVTTCESLNHALHLSPVSTHKIDCRQKENSLQAGSFSYTVGDTGLLTLDSNHSVLRGYGSEIFFTFKKNGETILTAFDSVGGMVAESMVMVKDGGVFVIPEIRKQP